MEGSNEKQIQYWQRCRWMELLQIPPSGSSAPASLPPTAAPSLFSNNSQANFLEASFSPFSNNVLMTGSPQASFPSFMEPDRLSLFGGGGMPSGWPTSATTSSTGVPTAPPATTGFSGSVLPSWGFAAPLTLGGTFPRFSPPFPLPFIVNSSTSVLSNGTFSGGNSVGSSVWFSSPTPGTTPSTGVSCGGASGAPTTTSSSATIPMTPSKQGEKNEESAAAAEILISRINSSFAHNNNNNKTKLSSAFSAPTGRGSSGKVGPRLSSDDRSKKAVSDETHSERIYGEEEEDEEEEINNNDRKRPSAKKIRRVGASSSFSSQQQVDDGNEMHGKLKRGDSGSSNNTHHAVRNNSGTSRIYLSDNMNVRVNNNTNNHNNVDTGRLDDDSDSISEDDKNDSNNKKNNSRGVAEEENAVYSLASLATQFLPSKSNSGAPAAGADGQIRRDYSVASKRAENYKREEEAVVEEYYEDDDEDDGFSIAEDDDEEEFVPASKRKRGGSNNNNNRTSNNNNNNNNNAASRSRNSRPRASNNSDFVHNNINNNNTSNVNTNKRDGYPSSSSSSLPVAHRRSITSAALANSEGKDKNAEEVLVIVPMPLKDDENSSTSLIDGSAEEDALLSSWPLEASDLRLILDVPAQVEKLIRRYTKGSGLFLLSNMFIPRNGAAGGANDGIDSSTSLATENNNNNDAEGKTSNSSANTVVSGTGASCNLYQLACIASYFASKDGVLDNAGNCVFVRVRSAIAEKFDDASSLSVQGLIVTAYLFAGVSGSLGAHYACFAESLWRRKRPQPLTAASTSFVAAMRELTLALDVQVCLLLLDGSGPRALAARATLDTIEASTQAVLQLQHAGPLSGQYQSISRSVSVLCALADGSMQLGQSCPLLCAIMQLHSFSITALHAIHTFILYGKPKQARVDVQNISVTAGINSNRQEQQGKEEDDDETDTDNEDKDTAAASCGGGGGEGAGKAIKVKKEHDTKHSRKTLLRKQKAQPPLSDQVDLSSLLSKEEQSDQLRRLLRGEELSARTDGGLMMFEDETVFSGGNDDAVSLEFFPEGFRSSFSEEEGGQTNANAAAAKYLKRQIEIRERSKSQMLAIAARCERARIELSGSVFANHSDLLRSVDLALAALVAHTSVLAAEEEDVLQLLYDELEAVDDEFVPLQGRTASENAERACSAVICLLERTITTNMTFFPPWISPFLVLLLRVALDRADRESGSIFDVRDILHRIRNNVSDSYTNIFVNSNNSNNSTLTSGGGGGGGGGLAVANVLAALDRCTSMYPACQPVHTALKDALNLRHTQNKVEASSGDQE